MPWSPKSREGRYTHWRIHIDPLYLDREEVTNQCYAGFLKATRHAAPYHWKDGRFPNAKGKYPVVNITWTSLWVDANPTPKQARFGEIDGPGETGKTEPNYFGLHDIIGNVREWTAD